MKKDVKRKSFVFYIEWQEVLMEYPSEVRLEVYDAIIRYAASGTLSELKPLAKMAFSFIKKQIDSNNDKYDCLVEKRSEAGKKGMANRYKPPAANLTSDNKDSTCYQDVTNLTSDNKSNYNEPVNVNDNNNSLYNTQGNLKFPLAESFDTTLDKCLAELKSEEGWLRDAWERAYRNGFKTLTFEECRDKYVDLYFWKLKGEGVSHKSVSDAKHHFSNWLITELKKQKNDDERTKSHKGRAIQTKAPVTNTECDKSTEGGVQPYEIVEF